MTNTKREYEVSAYKNDVTLKATKTEIVYSESDADKVADRFVKEGFAEVFICIS